MALCASDEGGAGDLDDGGDDVAEDEGPEDESGRQGRVGAADGADQHAEQRVDGRAEEDGRDHDEEVLQDEVEDVVRVLFRG